MAELLLRVVSVNATPRIDTGTFAVVAELADPEARLTLEVAAVGDEAPPVREGDTIRVELPW